jgi:hypothetical protein
MWAKLDPGPIIGLEIGVAIWAAIISLLVGAAVAIFGTVQSFLSRSLYGFTRSVAALALGGISVIVCVSNMGWGV